MQHDASRVVQAAIQFGNIEQRTSLLKELASSIPELAKIQYAHFVVIKLINYCGGNETNVAKKDNSAIEQVANQRRTILKAFKGHMTKLAVHAVGARCVELLFGSFPPKEIVPLRYELYGPHLTFSVSATHGNKSLMELIQQLPDKRENILKFLSSLLSKAGDKGLYSFEFYQKLYWEYVQCLLEMQNEQKDELALKSMEVGKQRIQQEVAPTVSEHAIQMISSRAGTRVMCECAAYGTAKDRKKILKSLKGYTLSSMLHRDAYLLILRVLETMDDTVTVQKMLLQEITVQPKDKEEEKNPASPLLELALHDTASKIFLRLLAPETHSYMDPLELDILAPATMTDADGNSVSTSKKDISVKQAELLKYLQAPLEQLALKHTLELLRSNAGSKVLREIMLSFPTSDLAKAIVASTHQTEKSADDKQTHLDVFEDPITHLVIKTIVMYEVEDEELTKKLTQKSNPERLKKYRDTGISVAKELYNEYKGSLMDKIGFCNRGAFVLEAMCHVKGVGNDVKKELAVSVGKLEQLGKEHKGFECLAKLVK